jgi:hypothetical protein
LERRSADVDHLMADVFLACATCHRGSDYTMLGSFDVGTGAFQVPQLDNLAFRAHDLVAYLESL